MRVFIRKSKKLTISANTAANQLFEFERKANGYSGELWGRGVIVEDTGDVRIDKMSKGHCVWEFRTFKIWKPSSQIISLNMSAPENRIEMWPTRWFVPFSKEKRAAIKVNRRTVGVLTYIPHREIVIDLSQDAEAVYVVCIGIFLFAREYLGTPG